ncbi:GPH family glycoside/pentoside/hexuronide:cation symporter [Stenotrophomonas sp. 2619]
MTDARRRESTAHTLSIREKLGYSLGDLAANLIFQTLITYLAFFYTDVFRLPPATAATIIFVIGLLGAFVFTPLIGIAADRTATRWGKFRPWILWTAIPFGVLSLLAFSTPDLGEHGKVVYALTTYGLLMLVYAANNLPYSALSGVLTGSMAQRNSLSAYRFVAVMIAQFIIQVLLLPLVLILGDGDRVQGFERVMTVFAVVGTAFFLITFATTRERIVPAREQTGGVLQDLTDLLRNRPWQVMLALTVLVFINLALKGGTYVYYFQYYMREAALTGFLDSSGFNHFIDEVNTALSGWGLSGFTWPKDPATSAFSLFNACGILCMILGIGVSRHLADRFGKRSVFGGALLASTVFLLAFYFFPPTAVAVAFGAFMLHGFFYGITIPLLWAMIADVADYSEWKNHRRATAIIFSAMLCGLKIGLSIGGALVAGILAHHGYQAGAEQQPQAVVDGIRLTVSVYCSLPFLLAVTLLLLYEIDRKMEARIEHDLHARRQAGNVDQLAARAISQPLVTHIHTADPSAHVFEGRLYIYPSHDIDSGAPFDDEGGHFGMEDYHVLRMDTPTGETTDCGVALHVRDVPWAAQQMWAPDAACRDGRYYLYFPAKDRQGMFRIGVAASHRPEGPFIPEPEPMAGTYSIDPAVYEDDDGTHYLYFGGIWGGQLQKYRDNRYDAAHEEPAGDAPALGPRVGRLDACMTRLAEPTREIIILDEHGQPLRADDHARRFFEGPWLHKYQGRYYLSYSTGDTHLLCYAVGDSPYGPFTYGGVILTPVVGWTTHHSICAFEGQWYLFYHDAVLSGGVTHLRSVKCTPLHMEADGSIRTIHPYGA